MIQDHCGVTFTALLSKHLNTKLPVDASLRNRQNATRMQAAGSPEGLTTVPPKALPHPHGFLPRPMVAQTHQPFGEGYQILEWEISCLYLCPFLLTTTAMTLLVNCPQISCLKTRAFSKDTILADSEQRPREQESNPHSSLSGYLV